MDQSVHVFFVALVVHGTDIVYNKHGGSNNMHKRNCLTLFFVFFRIGLFTFGGGYAMVPLIHKEAVEKRKWIGDEEILDLLAIAQSTPGPMAINTATYVGYKVGGIFGSLAATLGVVLPSVLIILFISIFYQQFRSNVWINYAFMGIRAGVAVLLINATIQLGKSLKTDLFSILLVLCAFCVTVFWDSSSVWMILAGALAGIIRQIIVAARKGENE